MTGPLLQLKEYQQAGLNRFRDYLESSVTDGASVAYYKATRNRYVDAPQIAAGAPYVCLRIPTGGGKTLMAAHAVGIAADSYLHVPNPMVLWLVPSTAIRTQTVSALKMIDHPYRAALASDFGHDISILTKDEALSMSRADAEGGACIIVSTIQAFRRTLDTGEAHGDELKVYQDAGALMGHFAGLSKDQIARLDRVEGTDRPVASLANLLKLHRPMVIVDEAHNARTSLSFDTLSRFDPSLILELTATPQTLHDPAREIYPSNVLHSVSAAELKAEHMIKMPIRLTTDRDWRTTIGAALDCRDALEEAARAETVQTGAYLRPIILFQAQTARKAVPDRLTYDRVEAFLRDDRKVPADQIAVHTGNRKDLDAIPEVGDPACPVRYIITVQKLKEGWDCPFAYVLCSVAEQTSPTAVEQILGRVLRMPGAKPKNRPTLNEAYAFVASSSFNDTAQRLKDGLVDGAGFNRAEIDSLVPAQSEMGYDLAADESEHVSDALDDDVMDIAEMTAAIARLPVSVRTRLRFTEDTRKLTFTGPMTKEARNLIHLALARSPTAVRVIDRLYAASNNLPTSGLQDAIKPPFMVPLLGFRRQGELELFAQEHFLDLPWRLDACDASDIVNRFRIRNRSQTGHIDISGKGTVEIRFARRVQSDLAEVVREPAWDVSRLVNWLDRSIPHPDVTRPSAVLFFSNALKLLEGEGIGLDDMARYKRDLREALRGFVADLRYERQVDSYGALFAAEADQFATNSELSMIFDDQSYSYNQPYAGGRKFNKHYVPVIGDLKPRGEEFDCAVYLDEMEKVKYWIRNVERKRSSFWLQLPSQKFYPDFVAMLDDGRILVVEYKGKDRYEQEEPKRRIGAVWAKASGGTCLFCMPTDRNFAIIDQTIAAPLP